MSENQVIYEISRQSLTYLQNWFFLSNLEFKCLHAQIRCTRIFIKILFQDKKWQRLQYCNFHQYQHIFAVAGWNHPYGKALLGTRMPYPLKRVRGKEMNLTKESISRVKNKEFLVALYSNNSVHLAFIIMWDSLLWSILLKYHWRQLQICQIVGVVNYGLK